MKTSIFTAIIAIAAFTNSCRKDNYPPLTDVEKNDLIFLREEEKLARDVYNYAYELYGTNIFQNIAKSEQSHMEKVKILLDFYGLPDPALNKAPGEFSNSNLSALYIQLTEKCTISENDAFLVGATIEDMDLFDIKLFNTNTAKTDLLATYELLSCGSRNHLRSFNSKLSANGISYIPQYIALKEFDEIIADEKESCESN